MDGKCCCCEMAEKLELPRLYRESAWILIGDEIFHKASA